MSTHPTFWQRLAETITDFFTRPCAEQRILRALRKNRLDQMEALISQHQWDLNGALQTCPPAPEKDFWGVSYQRHHTGWRLLHVATCLDNVEAVERLVEAGATVDIGTDWGMTPSLQAATRGHPVIVDFLASHGANLDRRLPSFSSYADDYIGPTVVEQLNQHSDTPYKGGEYAFRRAERLDETFPKGVCMATAKARL